jgi:hypothetical protein
MDPNALNLGMKNDCFNGRYGFIATWGPQRLATLGMAVADGKGGLFGTQKINMGTGTFVQADFGGSYNVASNGYVDVKFDFTLPTPDGGTLPVQAVFLFVLFQVQEFNGMPIATELRGVDTAAALDFSTGQTLQPPALGIGLFKRLF